MIKIDKNIPVPANASARYPWAEMEVGDSFFVEDKENIYSQQSSLSTAGRVWANAHKNGSKFITRKVEKGLRIWRIK